MSSQFTNDDTENLKRLFPQFNLHALCDMMRGSCAERAKLVVQNIEFEEQPRHHVCVASASLSGSWSIYVDSGIQARFCNNNVTYMIFKVLDLPRVRDLRREALVAIDSAETRGGQLVDRLNRVLDVFPGKANVLVHETSEHADDFGIYTSTSDTDNYVRDQRGNVVYHIWINTRK